MTTTDPKLITFDTRYRSEDIRDCVGFFGLSREEVMARLSEEHRRAIRLYEEANPQTPEEVARFYESTDAHIFEGLAWHSQPEQRLFRERIAAKCRGRVLDWGCGVATEGILAARNGCDVTFVDYPKTLAFIQYRLDVNPGKRADVTFWKPDRDRRSALNPDFRHPMFDVIICLDVLEHLEDPEDLLVWFANHLHPQGLFIGSAPFSELQWPGHLKKHRGKLLSRMCDDAGIQNYWVDPIRPQRECGKDT